MEQLYYFSSLPRCVSIGQFARLLLTVVMVAVSQAPSPESNPNPPLPVNGLVVHYTTNNLIGGEFVQQRAGVNPCASASLACVNNYNCRLSGVSLCLGQQLPRPQPLSCPNDWFGGRGIFSRGISCTVSTVIPLERHESVLRWVDY